jgi:hypothetical protein
MKREKEKENICFPFLFFLLTRGSKPFSFFFKKKKKDFGIMSFNF